MYVDLWKYVRDRRVVYLRGEEAREVAQAAKTVQAFLVAPCVVG